jgi:hypothetical protein
LWSARSATPVAAPSAPPLLPQVSLHLLQKLLKQRLHPIP